MRIRMKTNLCRTSTSFSFLRSRQVRYNPATTVPMISRKETRGPGAKQARRDSCKLLSWNIRAAIERHKHERMESRREQDIQKRRVEYPLHFPSQEAPTLLVFNTVSRTSPVKNNPHTQGLRGNRERGRRRVEAGERERERERA